MSAAASGRPSALAYVACAAHRGVHPGPIYLITIAAFSTTTLSTTYPKKLLPDDLVDGHDEHLPRLGRDHRLAVAKRHRRGDHAWSRALGIGAPAGYALARFAFRGPDPFQLAILITRAFPIVILAVPLAVTYIGWWHRRHRARGGPRPHGARAADHGADHRERLRGDLVRARGGGADAGLQPARGLSQGGPAAGAARPGGGGIFIFVMSWNEVFAAVDPDRQQPHAAGPGADRPRRFAAPVPVRRRLRPARARR